MLAPLFPSLYQINTRAWLHDLAAALGRPATLDDVPDTALDALEAHGFDWIWLLGVWQTGPAARAVSRSRPDWGAAFAAALPELTDEDITGSPFAVQAYAVHADVVDVAADAWLEDRFRNWNLQQVVLVRLDPVELGGKHAESAFNGRINDDLRVNGRTRGVCGHLISFEWSSTAVL